ncbi:hypothetical protein Cgig2_025652 [Carnegiea gigantea]|uniref:Zinc knuckle CX2CX4HX4C domain-containing protein n=1 Tax=Carnegiea gigantea TaxID=171969 RepID=A0A9Q1GK76_9CARY|nr:hypothetical protein Cgig2_025652 [Carnegiea gigantea]
MARGQRGGLRQVKNSSLHSGSATPASSFTGDDMNEPAQEQIKELVRPTPPSRTPIQEKAMIRYARVLVDMQLEGPFPGSIEFFNGQYVLIRQEVKYAWIPIKCLFCGMFGHEEEKCKKKAGNGKEWRVKQPIARLCKKIIGGDNGRLLKFVT